MANYARLADTLVVETIEIPEGKTPFDLFADPIAEMFVEAPAEVERRWQLIDGQWIEPEPIPEPEPALEARTITRLAFRNRFTFSEKVAIETASDTTPSVRVMLKDTEAASFIDLTAQSLTDGLALLVGEGLITEARAGEIQSAPVQESERP